MTSAVPSVMARARKKNPGIPVSRIRGRKTTTLAAVEAISGLAMRPVARMIAGPPFGARRLRQLAGDRFDHDDDLVDDETDGNRKAADAHQIERHSGALDHQDGHGHGNRNDGAGHHRHAEAAQEDVDDDQRQEGAEQDGVAQRILRSARSGASGPSIW